MVADDFVYVSVLVGSIVFGYFAKRIHSPSARKNFCTITGICIVFLCCNFHCIHTIVTIFINACIIKYTPLRYCHILSFAWSFGYLAFFRMTSSIGIPQPSPLANAVQLFLTLRCVSVAFEVHDSVYPLDERSLRHVSPERAAKLHQKYVAIDTCLSWLDIIHYCYSYIGLLTGPYYKYRVYQDFIRNDRMSEIDSWTPLLRRLTPLPVIATAYLLINHYFKISDTQTAAFASSSLGWRMGYIVPMFIIFRTRLYINFILSECACIAAGLGAYPAISQPRYGQGPSDLLLLDQLEKTDRQQPVEYDFTTVRNLDLYLTELGTTVRDGMRGWNMSVQYFQVHHVYRRFPIKSIRVLAVMTVTSFWHGLHPGYYLCFLTVPFVVFTEDLCMKAFRNDSDKTGNTKLFDWLYWVVKMRQFEYMSMPFLLLEWDTSIVYWASVYYFMHFITLALLLLAVCATITSKLKKHLV